MKKTLLFAAMAALMASCANEETVNVAPQGNAIGFDTFVGKVTKGDAVTIGTLESFYVYGGYQGETVFDNQPVIFNGSWTYTPLRYWEEGKDHYFAAVAPSVDATFDLTDLKVSGYVAGDDDLIVATTGKITALAEKNPSVNLNFKHALAQVKFEFTNVPDEGEVTNVKLSNVNSKADLTVNNTTGITWGTVSEPTTYKVDGSIFVLPQDVKAEMLLTFSANNKNYEISLSKAALTAWELGKAYKYNVNMNEKLEAIDFDVTLDTWTDGSGSGSLNQPGESQGPRMEEVIENLNAVASSYIRKDANGDNSSNKYSGGDLEFKRTKENGNMFSFLKFDLSSIDADQVESATLKVVITQCKGDRKINVFSIEEDVVADLTYDLVGETVEALWSDTPAAQFSAKGWGNFALKDVKSDTAAEWKDIAAWTNDDIDLTDAVNDALSNEYITLVFTKDIEDGGNNSMKIGSETATLELMKKTDNDATENFDGIKDEDLRPVLTIKYKKVAED